MWLPVAVALLLTAGVLAGCVSSATTVPSSAAKAGTPIWTLSERGAKTDLIRRLDSPPDLIVLGGSRALRFQPSCIHRLTGLTAFNAAVPGATPEDEWAFVNLFHSRFPAAHFRFLWVIHVDEFDEFRPSAGLLTDPFLSRFLPPGLVSSRLRQMGPSADASLLADAHHTVVLTPDGYTISDPISAEATNGTSFQQRVRRWIGRTLRFYDRTPPQIDLLPDHYFRLTLALMNSLGAEPTVVLAPLQPAYLAAIYDHGWEARHRMVLAYLRSLQKTYRFHLLDFSRPSSIGGSPTGFYDAVHMRPATTRLVVDAVLRALPDAFAMPTAPQT